MNVTVGASKATDTETSHVKSFSQEQLEIIRRSIEIHDQSILAGYRLGGWHRFIVRLLMRIRDAAERRKADRLSHPLSLDFANVLAFGARLVPRRVASAWFRRRIHRNRHSDPAKKLLSEMYRRGFDPRMLVDLATNIRQPREFRSFWHDVDRNIVHSLVVGLDCLPTGDGWTIVESNSSIGQSEQWELDCNPNYFIENMLNFAGERGCRNVVVVNNDRGLQGPQEEYYLKAAAARNMDIDIVEPDSVPAPKRQRSPVIPRINTSNTLCVRIRNFKSVVDYPVTDKEKVLEIVARYVKRNAVEFVTTPDQADGWIDRVEWDSGEFPNLVSKLPDTEHGTGIVFYKARCKQEGLKLAAESHKHRRVGGLLGKAVRQSSLRDPFLQPYVRTNLYPDRLLANFRANLLISPVGCRLLSVTKIMTVNPVPAELEFGVVKYPNPYLANSSGGMVEYLGTKEEFDRLQPVALAVGDALSEYLSAHFAVGTA